MSAQAQKFKISEKKISLGVRSPWSGLFSAVDSQPAILVSTIPTAEILSGKNAWAFLVCGFLMKSFNKISLKYKENCGSRLEV